jgi:septal ring factor EnvC (AmiA/AmiB activator)
MSIDWDKVESSPNSKVKLVGKDLLELKNKIADLEEDNFKKEEQTLKLQEKLAITERSFKDIINKATQTEKNLKIKISALQEKLSAAESQIEKQGRRLANLMGSSIDIMSEAPSGDEPVNPYIKGFDSIFNEFNSLRKDVEQIRLTHRNEFKINKHEISQVNDRLDNLIGTFEETIPETNKEIERLKEELKVKDKQIKVTKENLDEAILSKDQIIQKLESDLEAKIEEINELNSTVDALYTQISEFKNTPKVIGKIIDAVKHKGSISDKELEKILEKGMKKYQ